MVASGVEEGGPQCMKVHVKRNKGDDNADTFTLIKGESMAPGGKLGCNDLEFNVVKRR